MVRWGNWGAWGTEIQEDYVIAVVVDEVANLLGYSKHDVEQRVRKSLAVDLENYEGMPGTWVQKGLTERLMNSELLKLL